MEGKRAHVIRRRNKKGNPIYYYFPVPSGIKPFRIKDLKKEKVLLMSFNAKLDDNERELILSRWKKYEVEVHVVDRNYMRPPKKLAVQNLPLPDVVDNEENFRRCTKCGDELIDIKANWHRRAKGKNTGTCSNCFCEYLVDYYSKNKDKVDKKNKDWRNRNPDYLEKWRKKNPGYAREYYLKNLI